mmetsp:Transcript_21572/g.23953  ORF Transcript_21572/g.23953 Transcript_21572/m.23953 type:complete len:122 (-) Transcript_21572:919-1284(-)
MIQAVTTLNIIVMMLNLSIPTLLMHYVTWALTQRVQQLEEEVGTVKKELHEQRRINNNNNNRINNNDSGSNNTEHNSDDVKLIDPNTINALRDMGVNTEGSAIGRGGGYSQEGTARTTTNK